MKDIAQDLGISVMAVSKALRDHKDIGEETKARVLRRADELGYRVDWVARSMVTGRTFLVGLVIPDLKQSFFAEIATAISAVIAPDGYHLLISHSGENKEEEREDIGVLVSRQVDGLVIATAQRDPAQLATLRTPYVLIDRMVDGLDANYVGSDDEAIGAMATAHLAEIGCTRIAHLSGPPSSNGAGRLGGYRAVLAERGLAFDPALVAEAGKDDDGGYRTMTALLASGGRPDGLFCFNDPVAVGALRAIFEAGLRVPDDIAVIGAANMRYSDMLRVPLSTIDQGAAAIGDAAARLLLDMIAAPSPPPSRKIVTPLALRSRASTAPAGTCRKAD